MRTIYFSVAFLFCAFAPLFAHAKVIDAKPHGFKIEHELVFDESEKAVFKAIINPQKWWLSSHTWSGKSENLYLEPIAGGCFCERLNPGSVSHLQVVYFKPNKELRLFGALGPLQTMGTSGHMIFALSKENGKTTLKVTYIVGGYWEKGLENLAPAVDSVLGQQTNSLASFIKESSKQ